MGQQPKFQKQFKSLEIKANYTCNSRCDYCCISNNQHKRSMSHEEITSNVIFFKDKYDIGEICLSGGEPTIHEEFLANLNFICAQGLRVYLHTNGIKFHDDRFAGTCSPFLDRVLVGFSFHNENLCRCITRTGKTFEKRISGIKNLIHHDVAVRTNTVIVRSNYRYLPEISKKIGFLGLQKALFTLPFFFEAKKEQIKQFVPESFEVIKPYIGEAIDTLLTKGIKVSLQGLPPCKLGEFEEFSETDPDRAFIDSTHQFEQYKFLFSDMLGYTQRQDCAGCVYAQACWGYPRSGALGELGKTLSLPQ